LKLDLDDAEDENKGKTSVRFLDANTIRMEDLDSEFQRRHPLILRRSTSESPAGK
jgi:hypothetical protein